MSLQNLERYIQELEAINNYSNVMKESEELSGKVAALEASLGNTSAELAGYKELKVQLGDGGEISLEGARLDFLKAMDSETEKRANESFNALKLEYEAKMPQLVYQRLVEILKGQAWPLEMAAILGDEVAKSVDRILYHSENWPDEFKVYYQEQVDTNVQSNLNAEFKQRVEEKAEMEAQQRLSELVNAVWPVWFNNKIQPLVTELERKANENAFQLLIGPWTFTCDQCDSKYSIELTSAVVTELLGQGWIQIECINPECKDISLFSSRRHQVRVSVRELIEACITPES